MSFGILEGPFTFPVTAGPTTWTMKHLSGRARLVRISAGFDRDCGRHGLRYICSETVTKREFLTTRRSSGGEARTAP